MKTEIPPFDSDIKDQLIPQDSYSHYQHCSDLWAFELKRARDRILHSYTQLSEQKYRLAIPFAKHIKLRPLEQCVFVIVLFESLCNFYHGISISGPTVVIDSCLAIYNANPNPHPNPNPNR